MRRGDDGVAAVEFAIVATLFMLLAFGAVPLYSLARAYQQTSSASASAIRYATSVERNSVLRADGTYNRRPTAAEVDAFVNNAGLDVTTWICDAASPDVCTHTDTACTTPLPSGQWCLGDPRQLTSGQYVKVRVAKDVDLRVLGPIANAVAGLTGNGSIAPEGVVTISSTATGREE